MRSKGVYVICYMLYVIYLNSKYTQVNRIYICFSLHKQLRLRWDYNSRFQFFLDLWNIYRTRSKSGRCLNIPNEIPLPDLSCILSLMKLSKCGIDFRYCQERWKGGTNFPNIRFLRFLRFPLPILLWAG